MKYCSKMTKRSQMKNGNVCKIDTEAKSHVSWTVARESLTSQEKIWVQPMVNSLRARCAKEAASVSVFKEFFV